MNVEGLLTKAKTGLSGLEVSKNLKLFPMLKPKNLNWTNCWVF